MPDSQKPKGETGKAPVILSGVYEGRTLKPGSLFPYKVYIPGQYDPSKPAAVYVCKDGLGKDYLEVHSGVLDKLIAEGASPVCIGVYISSGELKPSRKGGMDRGLRAEEYDQIGRDYPDFIVDEFLPWLVKKEELNISPSPDMHMIGGGSSGGICAWNAAWFRNDYFRRAFLSSPTFSAIRGGEELMPLARKTETRPIRAYVTLGENEPDLYAGSSYVAGLTAETAFKYAGYDYQYEYFPGGGHCHGITDPAVIERAMRFLWRNWKTEPVKPLHNSERVERLVPFGSRWEETNEPMPAPVPAQIPAGVYSFEGGTIHLTSKDGVPKAVADGFGEISGLAVSSDRWRLYIADRQRRFIFAMSILEDGTLKERYVLAPLHLAHDCRSIGAADLCVDSKDRVYAATELGVQGIISFGVTDSIIPLPGDLPVEKLAFGEKESNILYARSGDKIFKRPWKERGLKNTDAPAFPGTKGYYD